MAKKELGWFKFSPLNWMTGRIRKEKESVQIAFVELMCQYWKNGCSMTVDQASLEIGDRINILLKKKIVKQDGDYIKISFLDEQMVSIEETSKSKRDAALSRWKAKQCTSNADAMHVHKGAMQNDADKIREDKIRQEEIREDFIKGWTDWGNLIVSEQDHIWEQMRGRKVTKSEMDEFISVAVRNEWKMDTQQAFRITLKGFSKNGKHQAEPKNKYKIQ